MDELHKYLHDLMLASEWLIKAYHAKDTISAAVLYEEIVNMPVPPGGPDPREALTAAIAVQVDPTVSLGRRIGWTLEEPAPVESLRVPAWIATDEAVAA
jgi:hypothetical protein